MAVNQAHAGEHRAHDENLDHQANGNLAVWLGLVALTFMTASFVGSNVYLRGWNPSKFDVRFKNQLLLQDIPFIHILLLLVSVVFLLIAGTFFVKNRWRAFNLMLALTTLAYVGVMITAFDMMIWFGNYSPQVATIYAPTETIQFLLSVICVVLLMIAGWYSSFGSKRKINSFFPVAMNVWMYTAFSSLVIWLMEDVVSIGQFAAWCGQHLFS